MRIGDEARGSLEREIRPCPVDNYKQTVAESDEKEEVDEKPAKPGWESREVQLAEVSYSSGTADGCEASLVPVTER